MALNVRREAARAFFEALERGFAADEVLPDKQCVSLIVEKAQNQHAAASHKRFDAEAVFRNKLLFPKIDEIVADWCRRREIKADPYKVFRYVGPERGPTQHEMGIGPSIPSATRLFDRLIESAPEISDCRAKVLRSETSAVAPAMRLQHPLPFGAAGEARYGGSRKDFDRAIFQVVLEVATNGDLSRGWRYDCGFLVFYSTPSRREFLGGLAENWDDLRSRIWEAARTWVILI